MAFTRPMCLRSLASLLRLGVSYQPRSTSCPRDRKSTRLNSSHRCISYAVFCLKKKKPLNRSGPHTPTPSPFGRVETTLVTPLPNGQRVRGVGTRGPPEPGDTALSRTHRNVQGY